MSNIPVWGNAKLGTKLSIIAFVPFVLTSICVLAALAVLTDAYAEARHEQKSRQIISDCESSMDSLIMCGSLMGIYMRNHDPQVLDNFWKQAAVIESTVAKLRATSDEQSPQLRALTEQLDTQTREMEQFTHEQVDTVLTHKKKQSFLDLMNFRAQAIKYLSQEKMGLDQIEKCVNAEMVSHPIEHSALYWLLKNNISLALLLAIGISVFASLSLSRSIVFRLRLLTQKAMRLALLEAPEVPEKGEDEIAQVDHVFNDMAFQLLNAIKREQAAIACAADAIVSLGADGRVLSANDSLFRSWGFQKQDLIGKDVFQFVSPEAHLLLTDALKSQHGAQFEAAILNSSKKPMSCLWSTSFSPGEQATIAIVHDVTERKAQEDILMESEARTRGLMEHMPAGLVLISDRSIVRFANDTASKLFKRTSDELLGSQFTSFLSGSNFESPEAFPDLMSRRAQSYITGINGDDEVRLQLGVSKFGKKESEDLYLVVVVDYTQRFRFDELKQRLVAMIAHDIATPLMTVQSTLGMASSGMFGSMQNDLESDVASAEAESGKILKVFKNVVRFQKLAAGFSSMSAARLPLSELTRQALDVVAPQVEEKEIEIINHSQSDTAAVGDADKLSVLGATLLQTVVDSAASFSQITVDSSKEAGFAMWSVSVNDKQPPSEQLKAYWQEMDVFESAGQPLANDLDLILWRLLLYQCGAKITYTPKDNNEGYAISLRMPSLTNREISEATIDG